MGSALFDDINNPRLRDLCGNAVPEAVVTASEPMRLVDAQRDPATPYEYDEPEGGKWLYDEYGTPYWSPTGKPGYWELVDPGYWELVDGGVYSIYHELESDYDVAITPIVVTARLRGLSAAWHIRWMKGA